jgi:hypothetical protein
MDTLQKKFWFPAKTYGYGWGPPTCWQGWVVMAFYIALLVANAVLFVPHKNNVAFVGTAAALTLGLIVIIWLKGEPPRWRWGKDRK